MIKVPLEIMLKHMLRASGDDNFVSVKDLNEMRRNIEGLDSGLSAYFDHNHISYLMEVMPDCFARVDYKTEQEKGPGFMRALDSDEIFSDEYVAKFDFGIFETEPGDAEEKPKYKKLRRKILELVEPGLLDTGYNPHGLYK